MNALWQYIRQSLSDVYSPGEARELAFRVMEECTSLTRTQMLSDCKGTQNIPNLEIILQKLRQYEPIEYIFSHTQWLGLDLKLNSATLIPRPETAELVQWVLSQEGEESMQVMDIGTGSGCIAIALKQQRKQWYVSGVDISEQALEIARENADRNGVDVEFRQMDILRESFASVDVVVSNPPYVREMEKADMAENVLRYEPKTALFVPDADPLLFYRSIAQGCRAKRMYFEINEYLSHDMVELMRECGYSDIVVKQDQYGKARMLRACL